MDILPAARRLFLIVAFAGVAQSPAVGARVPILAQAPLTQASDPASSVEAQLFPGDEVIILSPVRKKGLRHVQLKSCSGGMCDYDAVGWVDEAVLGHASRFTEMQRCTGQTVEGEIGDYAFTLDVATDCSFVHRFRPCVDCGESPDCGLAASDGEDCVSHGRLSQTGRFVRARLPAHHEYFLLGEGGRLTSVYWTIDD